MATTDPLGAVQLDVTAALLADPYFSNPFITVVSEKMGDIQSYIDQALGPLGGVLVLVQTPVGRCTNPNVRPIYFDNINIVTSVLENVIINQQNQGVNWDSYNARVVAQYVAALLHSYRPTSGVFESIFASNPTMVMSIPRNKDGLIIPGFSSYKVFHQTKGGAQIDPSIPFIADPVAMLSGGNWTITCATSPVAIYYTSDGTYPSPRNPTSMLYTTPFPLTSPGTLKIRGWWPGSLPSNLISTPF